MPSQATLSQKSGRNARSGVITNASGKRSQQPPLRLQVSKAASKQKQISNTPAAAPTKRVREQEQPSPGASKKQRVQSLQQLDESESESNPDIPQSSPLRKSTSRSTLANDDDDDELELFEEFRAKAPAMAPAKAPAMASAKKTQEKTALGAPSDSAEGRKSTISSDTRASFEELSIHCRLLYLARFHLMPHPTIIKAVWGDEIKKQSWEWAESNSRINWNGSNWKGRAIDNMMVKVEEYIKSDTANMIGDVTEYTPLVNFFASKYSASAFAWVFDFTYNVINIEESQAEPRVLFYFKNIWANFATRVKLHMDWRDDPAALHDDDHNRTSLMKWFNVMALSTKYNVSIKDFIRLDARGRRSRDGSDGPVRPDDDVNYVFVGTPPPE